MNVSKLLAVAAIAAASWVVPAAAAVRVEEARGNAAEAFELVADGRAAAVVTDPADYRVVQIAAELFAGDVERVTGVRPSLEKAGPETGRRAGGAVLAGTLGHSPLIDGLVREKGINVAEIAGKWECFVIVPVENPVAGVARGLVVIGSDRRGTAHGLMELSERIGVSPWEWWADVPAARKNSLFVATAGANGAAGPHVQGEPSVKYRGIFLNDEDWGLQPWAAKTFEPKEAGGTGDVGPKTYAKIFELLLRLRANFCWPAMHPSTQAFNIYPQNKQVADDYAIVMGSSHCEPMLRNNVTEWGQAKAASYNYVTNREGVLDYWRQRVRENGKFENVYTLGMRGIHDSDMAGGGTREQRVERLNAIMRDQRQMITELITPDVAKVPQIFCPYKEVLTLYQNGAVPPDDVTLVWADDNHGYIRQLSTPEEQRRPGGAGVYYHISYWGFPHDYLWLCTTPPSLVWEELSKAYDYGARTLWVINVGDLKPSEIDLTLAMRMAYDSKRYTRENVGGFLNEFARETFGLRGKEGGAQADEIASILKEYYRLNYQRKPEHLGFNQSQGPATPVGEMEFTDTEIEERLAAFSALVEQANKALEGMPSAYRDAYFELVAYPVRGAALQNEKMLCAEKSRRLAAKKEWAEALRAEERSRKAFAQIAVETRVYNETVAGGKWNNMMSAAPRNLEVFRLPKYAALPEGTGVGFDPVGEPAPKIAPRPAVPERPTYAERDGYVSIAAERFTRAIERSGAAWQVIPDLGRIGDSVAVFPTTVPSVDVKAVRDQSPVLEYEFSTTSANDAAKVSIQAIPTHRIHPGRDLRYAVAVDDGAPQVVDLETPENNKVWAQNVLRGAAYGTTTHAISAGRHVLRVYMVDPGVVIDQITIDLGGLKPSYLPPPETVAAGGQ
jgi:hypothetical protein